VNLIFHFRRSYPICRIRCFLLSSWMCSCCRLRRFSVSFSRIYFLLLSLIWLCDNIQYYSVVQYQVLYCVVQYTIVHYCPVYYSSFYLCSHFSSMYCDRTFSSYVFWRDHRNNTWRSIPCLISEWWRIIIIRSHDGIYLGNAKRSLWFCSLWELPLARKEFLSWHN
jgi:hypothetical protein